MLEAFLSLSLIARIGIVYAVIINIISFFYYGFDKARSRVHGVMRVPEKTLLLLALLGGSPGSLLAMRYFRHKTKKTSFQMYFIIILLLQSVIFVWVISN